MERYNNVYGNINANYLRLDHDIYLQINWYVILFHKHNNLSLSSNMNILQMSDLLIVFEPTRVAFCMLKQQFKIFKGFAIKVMLFSMGGGGGEIHACPPPCRRP